MKLSLLLPSALIAAGVLLLGVRVGSASIQECADWINRSANATTTQDRIAFATKALELYQPGYDPKIKGTALFNRGSAYLLDKDFDKASADLEEAVKLAPMIKKAWINLGSVRLHFKRYAEAVDAYDRSLKLDWRSTPYVATPFIRTNTETKITDMAEENSDAGTYDGRGAAYQRLGKLDAALADYNRALEISPKQASFLAHRGHVLHLLKRDDDGRKDFDRALELDPNEKLALLLRASDRMSRYDFEGAFQDQAKLVAIEPEKAFNHQVYATYAKLSGHYEIAVAEESKNFDMGGARVASDLFTRAEALFDLARYQEALKDFLEVKEKDPKALRLYYFLAETYRNLKDFTNAASTLDAAIAQEPKNEELYMSQGNLFENQDKNEEALAAYAKAIEASPKWAQPHALRGTVFNKLKKYPEAAEEYGKAIEIDPKYAFAYYLRAVAFKQSGQTEKELADLGKAIELKPDDADALQLRASALMDQRRYAEALSDADKAVSLLKSTNAYGLRALIEDRLGKLEQAVADFTKAMELDSKDSRLPYFRASTETELRRFDAALADYDLAAQKGYEPALVEAYKGKTLETSGKLAPALESYAKSLAIKPTSDAYELRGFSLLERKTFQEAAADFQKATETDDTDAFGWCGRAAAAWARGDKANGITFYRKAIEKDDRFAKDLDDVSKDLPFTDYQSKIVRELAAATAADFNSKK